MNWLKSFIAEENFRIFMSYVGLLMESILPSIFFMTLWVILEHFNLLIVNHDHYLVLLGLKGFGIIYIFLAQYAFSKALEHNRNMKSFAEVNREKFAEYRDSKKNEKKLEKKDADKLKEEVKQLRIEYIKIKSQNLQFEFHFCMALISGFGLFLNILTKYENEIGGAVWVFSLIYIMYFLFRFTTNIEDPVTGIYRTKVIPLEWLKDKDL